MIKFLIYQVIKWYAKLTKKDFEKAVALVSAAQDAFRVSANPSPEERDIANAKKREYVFNALRKALPVVATWALNMLLEMAVGYLKKNDTK
jgi:hypothetical protein